MIRLFVCGVCIGLAIALARHQHTGMAAISAGCAALLAVLPASFSPASSRDTRHRGGGRSLPGV